MQRLAQAILLSSGRRRAGLAFLAGLCAALAMPPLYLFPALFIAMPLAVWLIDGAAPGRGRLSLRGLAGAFGIGWCFGFGYFLGGLWWLGAAFLVESEEFLWALPLGVLGLPAALALFHGFGFALARLLWRPDGRRVLALALGLGAAEYLRGVLFTGFPWNAFGQAFGASLPSLQAASLLPLEGLTFLAVLIAAAPATLGGLGGPARRFSGPVFSILAVMAVIAFGVLRLQGAGQADAAESAVPGVSLRIVQPNISQREKNREGASETVLRRYLELSDRATTPQSTGLSDATHVFWPESPFPFVLADEPQALAMIADALPPGTQLITGAVRLEQTAGGERRFYNALQAVSPDGVITASYDKVHLVPFGEYLPLASWLERLGLRQFVRTPGGFEAGATRKIMSVQGLPPFLPLICYEAIFPDALRGLQERPQLLINVTNDAWFGETFGPYQHFEQARMRAVESGLPLVRSANTGISAVIDPFGRILREIPLGESGVADAPLPRSITAPPAVRFGNLAIIFLAAALFLGCVFLAKVE